MATRRARQTLPAFVDHLQSTGRYVFRREEAEALGLSRVAIKNAARRLAAKGRIAVPRRGFYVIVPLEYRSVGIPPASWFVDDLMEFLSRPYYAGILTAAALHGAAHHGVQEFQVVTSKPLRPVEIGRLRIRFFVKRHLGRTPTRRLKTETGSMSVSTPEATALDLVRYVAAAGQLSNVATVLVDLAERLDPQRLAEVLAGDPELAIVQRLGYLLERVEQVELAAVLADWLAARQLHWVALNPRLEADDRARVEPWRVLENEVVEVDA